MNLLIVFVVFFCAVFHAASAQLTSFDPDWTNDQAASTPPCENKLLDDRIYQDQICKSSPDSRYGPDMTTITISTPQEVVKALQWNKIVIINLKFDENGNINESDQNQHEFIAEAKKFYNDPKWAVFIEKLVLQFGDDTAETQKKLDRIVASKVLSKALENNIVNTVFKFRKAFSELVYVGKSLV